MVGGKETKKPYNRYLPTSEMWTLCKMYKSREMGSSCIVTNISSKVNLRPSKICTPLGEGGMRVIASWAYQGRPGFGNGHNSMSPCWSRSCWSRHPQQPGGHWGRIRSQKVVGKTEKKTLLHNHDILGDHFCLHSLCVFVFSRYISN